MSPAGIEFMIQLPEVQEDSEWNSNASDSNIRYEGVKYHEENWQRTMFGYCYKTQNVWTTNRSDQNV